MSMSESLMKENIKVRLVRMENEDASDLGFQRVITKIKNTKLLDFGELMKQKLCMS